MNLTHLWSSIATARGARHGRRPTMHSHRVLRAVALAMPVWLAACGGGGASAPEITAQPADISVAEGEAARFSVSSNGDGPIAYQWQRNGVDIAGAIGASFTLPAARIADDGARFDAVARGSAGSITSQAATLTVTGATAVGTLGSSGGTITLTSNAVRFAITVPAGALAADTAFTLQSLPVQGAELARIAISPPGVAFGKPVTVTMTLPADHPARATQRPALRIGAKKAYLPGTVDVAAGTVTAQLSYFGLNGTALPSRLAGMRPLGAGVHVADAAPAPAPNTLTLEELAVLQPQVEVVNQALVDLQVEGRFQDAAALQLSIAALAQSAQVPEWQVDALTFLKQAATTVCTALDQATTTAQSTVVTGYGDYRRVATPIVYWEAASRALGAEGCAGSGWMDTLHGKLDQALTFVSGKVATPPAPSGYGAVAGEIKDATTLASEATLLGVGSAAADTRLLYVDPALLPLRAAAFQTSLTTTDQSEYLALLTAFGPTESLSDDAQYAATTFKVRRGRPAGRHRRNRRSAAAAPRARWCAPAPSPRRPTAA